MPIPTAVRRRLRAVRRSILARRRPLAAVLTALAVLAGLDASVGPAPPTIEVQVATHDLAAGAVLSKTDVTIVDWPESLAPEGLSHVVDGRMLAAPVRQGEALTDVRLVGSTLARAHRELTVMPLRLPDPAVVELLQVGDRIDLSAVDPESGETNEIASDVLVLAIPPAGEADSSLSGRLIVAGVAPDRAQPVAGAALRVFISVSYSR